MFVLVHETDLHASSSNISEKSWHCVKVGRYCSWEVKLADDVHVQGTVILDRISKGSSLFCSTHTVHSPLAPSHRHLLFRSRAANSEGSALVSKIRHLLVCREYRQILVVAVEGSVSVNGQRTYGLFPKTLRLPFTDSTASAVSAIPVPAGEVCKRGTSSIGVCET